MRSRASKLSIFAGCALAVLLAGSAAAQLADEKSTKAREAFKALCEKIQNSPDSASEREMISALDKAGDLGRHHAAAHALRKYLAANVKTSPALRIKAVENALMVADFPTAVVRCKAYLKDAKPGPQASEMVTTLYWLQIEMLGERSDAYREMSGDGDRFCTGVAARKFDAWYLAEARRKRDYAGIAKRLKEMYSAGMSSELTRLRCAGQLDQLMADFSTPYRTKLSVLPQLRELVGAIRGDEWRKAKYAFYVANFAYQGNNPYKRSKRGPKRKGVVPVEPDPEFAPVLAAAGAYLAKYPTARTVGDIMFVFTGGRDRRNPQTFMQDRMQGQAKRKFFTSAFSRLGAKERRALVESGINGYYASSQQWTELALKHPEAFRDSGRVDSLPVNISPTNPAAWKKLADLFRGSGSQKAALARALAAGGDFNQCVDYIVRQESWHLDGYDRLYATISQQMWRAYRAGRDPNNKLPGDYFDKAMLRFASEYLVKTPLAFGSWAATDYMNRAWRAGGATPDDKSKMSAYLATLGWVPYTPAERKAVFEPAYNEFKTWTAKLRTDHGGAKTHRAGADKAVADTTKSIQAKTKEKAALGTKNPARVKQLVQEIVQLEKVLKQQTTQAADAATAVKKYDAPLKLVSPLEAAFKRSLRAKSPDLSKAPAPLCRDLAQAVMAARAKNSRAFMAAARKVYPHVKDYEARKTLMGRHILTFLVKPSQEMDVLDFQCEVLTDQLRGFNPRAKAQAERIRLVAEAVATSRPNWRWGQFPAADRKKVLRINTVFAKALAERVEKGRFEPWLFERVLYTRRGKDWGTSPTDRKVNEDLMAKMIEKKVLVASPWRRYGRLAATGYMALVRGEFPGLAKKYPVETYFDDMLLAEAGRTKVLDPAYFTYGGQDKSGRIRELAARIVSGTRSLPRDGDDAKGPYTAAEFQRLQEEALRAKPAVRDAMLAKVSSYYPKTRFDVFAMGLPYFSVAGDINKPKVRKEFFTRLGAYFTRAEQSPATMVMPDLSQLKLISSPAELTDEELNVLLRGLAGTFLPLDRYKTRRRNGNAGALASVLVKGLVAKGRNKDLFLASAHLWQIARIDSTVYRDLLRLTDKFLADKKYDLSAVYSGVGLELFKIRKNDPHRNRLRIVRSRSVVEVGGLKPIDRSDPRYPVLAAQADFMNGNLEQAWQ